MFHKMRWVELTARCSWKRVVLPSSFYPRVLPLTVSQTVTAYPSLDLVLIAPLCDPVQVFSQQVSWKANLAQKISWANKLDQQALLPVVEFLTGHQCSLTLSKSTPCTQMTGSSLWSSSALQKSGLSTVYFKDLSQFSPLAVCHQLNHARVKMLTQSIFKQEHQILKIIALNVWSRLAIQQMQWYLLNEEKENEPLLLPVFCWLNDLFQIHRQMCLTTILLDENNFIQYFFMYHSAQCVLFCFQKERWVLRKLSAIYVLHIPQGLVNRAVYHILLGLA